MRRTLLLGAVLSAALGWPAAALEVQLAGSVPACAGGEGLEGTATADGVTIRFFSCARGADDCRSRIWKDGGGPLSEIRIEDASFRVWLGGTEATAGVTDDQAAKIGAALAGPERGVAAGLFPALRDLGLDERSDALRCLSYHGQAYDDGAQAPAGADCGGQCNDASGGCKGCCGPGCIGGGACTTACTWGCFVHDQLCGFQTDPLCVSLFVLAAKSMKDCYDTHPDCGRLVGPACECC
jgi:hypothetical protein